MAKTSPTQRTLKELRKLGFLCAITEHWNAFVKRRQDLFGFIDIIALRAASEPSLTLIELPGRTIGVQCTTSANIAARRTKILTDCREKALVWLAAGNEIHLWGWSLRGPRGAKKKWAATTEEITIADFTE